MAEDRTLTTQQVEALLRTPDVAQYLHFDSSPQRAVLGVALGEGLSGSSLTQFAIDGHRVLFSEALPVSEDDNIFVLSVIEPCTTAEFKVRFRYGIEGVEGDAVLTPDGGARVVDIWEG